VNKHRYAFSFAIAALAAGGALAGTTYHVAVTGNDDASGSATQPLRTIQRAADLAQPGDTVLVSPGIYRERVAPPRGGIEGLPIVYRSEKPHAAIVRGSDIWQPPWRQEAPGIWSGEVDEALFTDTAHRDGANPFEVPLSSTPGGRDGRPEHERGYSNSDPSLSYSLGQVFVDDQPVAEAPAVGEFRRTPGTWHYDAATRRLAIHFADDAPTTHAVELDHEAPAVRAAPSATWPHHSGGLRVRALRQPIPDQLLAARACGVAAGRRGRNPFRPPLDHPGKHHPVRDGHWSGLWQ
jgi:hypothetical protein